MNKNYKKSNKKAQSAGGAATLIVIITAIIILYILFLPPAERESLLETNGNSVNTTTQANQNNTLLQEYVGRLDYNSKNEIIHNIPSMNLYTLTRPITIKKQNSLYLRNGWFDKQFQKTNFVISDITNTDDVKLTFNVKKSSGVITIVLNGNVIYSNYLSSANIPPIEIQKSFLRVNNTLEFKVSSVGWRFWKTNEVIFSDILVVGNYKDTSTQESKLNFIITSTERENLKQSKLIFNPECEPTSELGKMEIYVNNHNIYSSIPDCGTLSTIEFSTNYLLSGENNLVFKTSKGKYLIDQINLKNGLKELSYPVYYFQIDSQTMQEIRDNQAKVNLTIEFADNLDYKEATVVINGAETHIAQKDRIYSKNLNMFVQTGNNAIEIIPKTILDIVKMSIEIN